MSTEESKIVEENGVKIKIPSGKKHAEMLKYFNSSLKTMREAVLGSLGVEVDQSEKALLCLDAVAGSGIAGLQWKRYYNDDVIVISADRHSDGTQVNSDINGLNYVNRVLEPDRVRAKGDPVLTQGAGEIHGSRFTGTVMLHHDSFNFVYVQPNGNIGPYLDSVFTHVPDGGLACFLSPNIASQCFRSPALIKRLYQAHVQKTDYVKEMAARVVISDIARAAARHGRGIEVLICLSAEDHILIVVKATKSTQAAVECVSRCRQVLHCLMCEERTILPDVYCPIEEPYSLLSCDCKSKKPGKTAVVLGPVWAGGIFSQQYIRKVVVKTRKHFPDSKVTSLLETLLIEAQCSNKDCPKVPESVSAKTILAQGDISQNSAKRSVPESETTEVVSVKKAKIDVELGGETEGMDVIAKDKSEQRISNETDVQSKNGAINKDVSMEETSHTDGEVFPDTPVFYYNLHRMRYKDLPKLDDLISKMRLAGFRASRTHFEVNCMRTTATGNQIQEVIDSLRMGVK